MHQMVEIETLFIFLALVNNAAMNIYIQVFMLVYIVSLGYTRSAQKVSSHVI